MGYRCGSQLSARTVRIASGCLVQGQRSKPPKPWVWPEAERREPSMNEQPCWSKMRPFGMDMNKCVIVYKSVQRIEEYRKLQLNALLVPFVLLLAMSLQPNHKSQVLTAIPKSTLWQSNIIGWKIHEYAQVFLFKIGKDSAS